MSVPTDRIRNVAIVGHQGSGKTSLVEALLYRAGVIDRPGSVDSGTAVCDTGPEERARHQSIDLAVASFEWNDHRINLLDAPGAQEFLGDARFALHAADLALFVIDAADGVMPHDVTLWRIARDLGLPRMIFVNKLDRERTSFAATLEQIRARFGTATDPVELPIGEASDFHGVVDLITDKAFFYDTGRAAPADIPTELADEESLRHDELVEDVVEVDDAALERYLEGEAPDAATLEALLHRALDETTLFPVLCGSATGPIGTDRILDLICRIGPSPVERAANAEIVTLTAGGAVAPPAAFARPDPAAPTVVWVFKTRFDDYLGQLSVFKVLSGTLHTDDELIDARTGDKIRLHQIISLRGAEHSPVREVVAGDVAAVAKLDTLRTGDTLSPDGDVEVPLPALSKPVHGIAVRARAQSDEERLAQALNRLLAADPTLAVERVAETGQTVLRGLGELHLQVALARLARLGIEVDTEDVRVAYRETLARPVEVEGKHKKQTGGHGQFGVATVRFEPLPRGSGFEFVDEIKGGVIPARFLPAVAAGIEEAMQRGGAHGYPVVDVRAVCVDGKHHSVDSSELAFKMAGSLAFRAAVEAVGTEVLEPISHLTVEVLDAYLGDVLGDLNSRRAQVLGTTPGGAGETTVIEALVPTSEITRYAVDLKAMTGGTGTFEAVHHGYQPLPANLLERLEPVDA